MLFRERNFEWMKDKGENSGVLVLSTSWENSNFKRNVLSYWEYRRLALQVIWWRNEKAWPKIFNAVSHNHVRSQVLFSHCQNVADHFPCLPNFLLLNAKSKSWSRTDGICPRDRHVKFKNNTSGRERLWDTALKFLCAGLFITSPDHLKGRLQF